MPTLASNRTSPEPEKPSGFTIRAKVLAGFGGMSLLMTLIMGITLYTLSKIEQIATTTIEQRQPAAHQLLKTSEELNLATTLLNGYLLTGYEENEREYISLQKGLQQRIQEATALQALSDPASQDILQEINKLLGILKEFSKKLIHLRKNPVENYPGLALAVSTLNGPANRFLGLNNILLSSDDIDLDRIDHRKAYHLLQELRYTWLQVMNNMRLFVSARGFADLEDFSVYIEQNGKIIDELIALDPDIGFNELEEMVRVRREYMLNVPAVVTIMQSNAWRVDADFMRDEVRPIVETLRQLLKTLADEQLDASAESGRALTHSLEQVRTYAAAILLIAILSGLLIAINITRGLLPPIERLMVAARHVAAGDLNAEIFITTNDELGVLSRSFNSMIDDLRTAALNEHQYTDELKTLNQNLENRVKIRTLELERNEAKTRAILDNIGEGIVTINSKGFIESINPMAEEIFNYSKQEIIGVHSALLLADKTVEKFTDTTLYDDEIDGFFRTRDHQQPAICQGKRADGSTFPMEFVVSSMALSTNNLRVCIVRDISARKETEETLAKAQLQLVDAAHKSGMAEMATGVLHNIGNILNSVNLASEEIARIAVHSKVQGLIKANNMLSAHREDLADFITQDPKGKKLPDYYLKLGKILSQEISDISAEAKSLIEKTTMMKEVISTQQDYASAGFHVEKLSLNDLLEDAIKIQAPSLHKWGVKLQRKYTDTPACLGQKSKLLQVLTNLIKNAKEAMEDNDAHNKAKELSIKAGILSEGLAYIKISDNGCGISKEQLSKIFNHGFTTKQEGHGFGLHSSANAMTEMKGALSVESDGINHGASFTVTIPIYEDPTQY